MPVISILNVRIIEDITAKNAALTTGSIQCMLNTLDSVVVARASGVPVKVIAIPAMSYGLDEMIVDSAIESVEDFPGRSYGADYAFLNHMWMLLTLKKAGIAFDALDHKIMLPQDSAAAFVSGQLDIDVNYKPFSSQSAARDGAHILKTSLSDRTWERGLISESISCNEDWLAEKPDVAKELLRAWFEAVDWWKSNPDEGNDMVAKGLDWPVADVRETQYGAVMLNLDQNLGAFGVGDGKPVCQSLPEGAPDPETGASGWGDMLFGGQPDCASGYLADTWDLFGEVYMEAGVIESFALFRGRRRSLDPRGARQRRCHRGLFLQCLDWKGRTVSIDHPCGTCRTGVPWEGGQGSKEPRCRETHEVPGVTDERPQCLRVMLLWQFPNFLSDRILRNMELIAGRVLPRFTAIQHDAKAPPRHPGLPAPPLQTVRGVSPSPMTWSSPDQSSRERSRSVTDA